MDKNITCEFSWLESGAKTTKVGWVIPLKIGFDGPCGTLPTQKVVLGFCNSHFSKAEAVANLNR